jgi:peptide/nickel transport system permease protein
MAARVDPSGSVLQTARRLPAIAAAAVRVVGRSRASVAGAVILVGMLALALGAPLIAAHDPQEINIAMRLSPMSREHLFGTDNLGRDIFSRVVHGARISLAIGLAVVAASGTVGVAIGLAAGYQRHADRVLMRVVDALMAFPGILLAIALMAVAGQRMSNIVIAMTVIFTPRMARVVRGVVLTLRGVEYVQAAQAIGARDLRIIWRHVLPNALPPMIVQGTFVFAESVLAEAALNFLGAGLPPDVPSWGTVIAAGRMFLNTAPWITVFPGMAIMVTVLGLNLLGDGLRDLTDPRLRGQPA